MRDMHSDMRQEQDHMSFCVRVNGGFYTTLSMYTLFSLLVINRGSVHWLKAIVMRYSDAHIARVFRSKDYRARNVENLCVCVCKRRHWKLSILARQTGQTTEICYKVQMSVKQHYKWQVVQLIEWMNQRSM